MTQIQGQLDAWAQTRLPSGRHRIPEQEVRDHQRARLLEAIALLCGERGFVNVVIGDIVARAGVSKATFYSFYRTKEECLLDAHKLHSAALIAAIDQSCRPLGRPAAEQLRVGINSALAYLSANPHAAYLLTIGILSCGPRGERRYLVMIEALRARVQSTGAPSLGGSALPAVLFAASTVAHTTLPQEEIKLSALESDLVEIFLAIGAEN